MRPESPSDPEPRTLVLPTGPARVTDAGDGPVVLALHGLPGTLRDFRWLGAAVEPHLRLVRVDLPGFGGTPRGARPLQDRAAFVVAVMDALGIDRAVVLGHSMGGSVATAVAAAHPDRVAGLVLLASIGHRPHNALRRIPFGPRVVSALLRRPARYATMPVYRRVMERIGFHGYDDDALAEAMHLVAATPIALHAANLAALRVPTMVVWAEDDTFVEAAVGEELYWRVPPGPRIRFPSGGHALGKSRASEIGEALTAWVHDPAIRGPQAALRALPPRTGPALPTSRRGEGSGP